MNIAVTGATGFVGKYIVEYFKNKDFNVLAIGRDLNKLNSTFDNTIVKKDTDYSIQSLLKILVSVDAIVHLAGKRLQKDLDPLLIEPYVDDNILLTQNLLKTAQSLDINRVCICSSIAVYSKNNTLPFSESDAPHAISIYGVSKLACENLGNLFSARSTVKVTNLRLASLFGCGEKRGVVFTDYIDLASKKEVLEIWGKGETCIDFLYIKDVLTAIEKAILPDAPFGTYNIGSGRCYTISNIAENINEVFDNKGNISYLLNKNIVPYKICMDNSKALMELNWKPEWPLRKALEDYKTMNNL
jgi:UDP-glucose 4-epimerase